ncbi:methylated-DNA--[protein]-cysteine S-methyltransferase [Sinanaerobacter chloroacetimidivorans]|jgi:methylated-DNA-[protein]-cysteine S-methyltransferase|uniref:Methylated-DNA--protein-cysteine methyltransferase n=1 Tax=Sinanaerobacter chloroacetimidivorans TaxID=2818044 RepID=A0A8J7W2K5_9FIRM|nr:methylated-DNA--[protein]-cysteine S-methyltransferase [Sinanaerobacter chloroacetimidivorans]MBR0597725.1 methylated-DNA--[protein]-cysteine S-methyltransferase [Sinanaerobacter chloroacetimidivorans]
MKNLYYYDTPIGRLGIAEENGSITNLYFHGENIPEQDYQLNETPLLKDAGRQLEEYFAGTRKDFSLPLAPKGTNFMSEVWEALKRIPYGETRSYKDIAEEVGNAKACRAVGMANNRNPIAIFIPCHRVIGTNGSLIGYGGGLDTKVLLLKLETKYK